MSKTRKHTQKKTQNRHKDELVVLSSTPIRIRKLSNKINVSLKKGSYSPTINKELVTLKSIERSDLMDCNTEEAFTPLKI